MRKPTAQELCDALVGVFVGVALAGLVIVVVYSMGGLHGI